MLEGLNASFNGIYDRWMREVLAHLGDDFVIDSPAHVWKVHKMNQ